MAGDKPRKVLLIDDDDLVRPVVERGLKRRNIPVLSVDDIAQAVALPPHEKAEIGVLLCDGTLAGFDPDALHADFAAHSPHVKLAVSSGYTPALLAERGVKVDPARFLQKPWGIPDLISLMEKLLDTDGDA